MPLGERGDCGDARYVGVELSFTGLAEPAVDVGTLIFSNIIRIHQELI
jgi:hypothetical protein